MKRAAPLLADRLPLYATDAELCAVILGERAIEPACLAAYRHVTTQRSFPRFNAVLGGRHVPSVLAWFDQFEAGVAERSEPSEVERADRWEKSGRRRSA